jgi:autotransporter-like protein
MGMGIGGEIRKGFGGVAFRGLAFGIVSLGILIGGQGAALASAGCTAVNAGGFNAAQAGGSQPASIKDISGFAVGDRIDFTVNRTAGAPNQGQWWVSARGGALLADDPNGPGIFQHSYTVTGTGGDTNLESVVRIQGGPSDISVTATCTSGTSTSTSPTDSQKLRAVQVQGSTMVAQASGAAITGAVGGAIGDAFANGGAPVTFGSTGMTFNFAADPQNQAALRNADGPSADDPFAALAYAGGYTKAPPLAPALDRQWSAWADVRGTGWNNVDTGNTSLKGTQLNLTLGIGYKFTPDLLVGIFGGYENFNYEIASLTGKLTGNGGSIGGYTGLRVAPGLRWDAMAGWSGLSYDGSAGMASGSFTGSRWLASTGLTGTYRVKALTLEPSANIYTLWEHQGEWTDSLGALQASRDFSVGRVSAGGRVIVPWQMTSTVSLSPYLGFYGDWRFSHDDAVPVGVSDVGLVDGWSGRVTGGFSVSVLGGGSLALGGEYGGIGAGYGVWTGTARMVLPF